MKNNNFFSRRNFLKLGGLFAAAGASSLMIGNKSHAEPSFGNYDKFELFPCDIQEMSKSKKLDLAGMLGKGVLVPKSNIDGYWCQDDVLDERVMQPDKMTYRTKTGEIDLGYQNGSFSIYAFASVYPEDIKEFFNSYIEGGRAEKKHSDIILRGQNLNFIKQGGKVTNDYLDQRPDREKLASYLKGGYFADHDPKHKKLTNQMIYNGLEAFANPSNSKIVFMVNPGEEIDYRYPVSVRDANNDDYQLLIGFPNSSDALDIKKYAHEKL